MRSQVRRINRVSAELAKKACKEVELDTGTRFRVHSMANEIT